MNNPLNKAKDAVANLLRRAYINLKSAKISQKITGLVISIGMALTLAGCDEATLPNPDINPGGEPPTHDEAPANPMYEEYSELLQNIMANKRYDELVDQIFINNKAILQSGEVEPHPYAFLEDEGYDVEAIKKGNDLAYTMSYVLDEEPNNLYMYTRVLNNDHYVNYLLKYELTDEEMDDYNLLHRPDGSAHFYLQSIFMNNEISKTRNPEIVGKTKITVDAFDKLTTNIQYASSTIDRNSCNFILLSTNEETDTFETIIIPRLYQDNYMTMLSKISKASFQSAYDLAMKDDIFTKPTDKQSFIGLSATQKEATFYFSQEANLAFVRALSFETKASN